MVEVLRHILSRGDKSVQIRFLFFHALPRATIAFRALLSPLFYVQWKIRFPSPTPGSKAFSGFANSVRVVTENGALTRTL